MAKSPTAAPKTAATAPAKVAKATAKAEVTPNAKRPPSASSLKRSMFKTDQDYVDALSKLPDNRDAATKKADPVSPGKKKAARYVVWAGEKRPKREEAKRLKQRNKNAAKNADLAAKKKKQEQSNAALAEDQAKRAAASAVVDAAVANLPPVSADAKKSTGKPAPKKTEAQIRNERARSAAAAAKRQKAPTDLPVAVKPVAETVA